PPDVYPLSLHDALPICSVKVLRTVAEGLDSPWGLAPIPGGGLLVASRDKATITHVDERTGKKTELGTVPGVAPEGEGGLLGIALDRKSTRLNSSHVQIS